MLFGTACQAANAYDIAVPETAVVTWRDRQNLRNERVIQCARDIGDWDSNFFGATPEDTSIWVTTPDGYDDVHDAIWEALRYCREVHPSVPQDQDPISATQAEAFYLALMDAGQCLRDLGFPISDPPSRQVIIADVMSPPWGVWYPWVEIFDLNDPQHSIATAITECPSPNLFDFMG